DRRMISTLVRWQIAIDQGFDGLKEEKGSCPTIAGIICDELTKFYPDNDYRSPVEEMFKGLKEFWGKGIFSLRAVRFRLKIDMEHKPSLRTLTIPLPISFQNFGRIIAASYGWHGKTPHFFEVRDKKTDDTIIISQDPFEEENIYFENRIKLTDYNFKQYSIRYVRGEEMFTIVNIEYLGTMDGFSMNHPLYEFGEGEAPPDGMSPDFYHELESGKLTDLRKELPRETCDWLEMQIRTSSFVYNPRYINATLERILQRFPDMYYRE
ncbi:MAG: hypothetical protein E4G74_03830, partial [Erysipelotrichales bacterium]